MSKKASVINGILRFRSKYMKKQINKSLKNFTDEQQKRIEVMINYFLKSEKVGYKEFLDLIQFQENKYKLNINCSDEDEELYKFALSLVFSEAYFNNKFSEKKFIEIMDAWITIHKDFKENLIIGPSGTGKTELFKYLIGAEESSYLAISDNNTTEGKNRAIIDFYANKLSTAVRIKGEEAIKERLKIYIQDCVDLCLKNECDGVLFKLLYDALILSKDSKWRLEFLICDEDLSGLKIGQVKFLDFIYSESQSIWNRFKKSKYFTQYRFNGNISYTDALIETVVVQQDLKKFVEDEIENNEEGINKILEEIYGVIIDKEYMVFRNIWNSLYKKRNEVNFKLQIIFNNIKVDLSNSSIEEEFYMKRNNFYAIETLCIEVGYKGTKKPDENLRNNFFEILENVSSNKILSSSLAPLLIEVRTYGNFRPKGFKENGTTEKEIYVISEGEGLLHDISSSAILSNKIQESIVNAHKIFLTYNTSTAESKGGIIPVLNYLIINGSFYKTKVCFTKLDLLSGDIEAKKTRIKGGMKNVVEAIDKNSDIQDLDTEIVLKNLMENAYYFSNMNKGKNLEELSMLKEIYQEFKEKNFAKAEYLRRTIEKTEEEVPTVHYINSLYNEFMTNINIEDISKYLADIKKPFSILVSKVVKNSINVQEEFVREFIKLLNESEWQTEKAFNRRIAENFDGREWRHLMPEAMLVTKLSLILRNSINSNIINKFDGNAKRCIGVYCDIMLEGMTKEVKGAVQRIVHENMLEKYWIPALKESGSESTYTRHRIITTGIVDEFNVDKEICEIYPSLYSIIAPILINNEKLKKLNVKLDCSK